MQKQLLLAAFIICLTGCKKDTDGFNANTGTYDHSRQVGASSNDLLSSKTYQALNIEVLYMPGFALQSSTLTEVKNFLSARLNKPSGINISVREIAASANTVASLSDIKTLEQSNRKFFTDNTSMAITVLITNGTYTQSQVLGIAYKNTSSALFGKLIHDNSGGLGQASRAVLETAVLEHELAHLLGLVDIGSPMVTNHKDAANGNHCDNKNCLMYYASETTDALTALIGGNVPVLDANCLTDLKANGGK